MKHQAILYCNLVEGLLNNRIFRVNTSKVYSKSKKRDFKLKKMKNGKIQNVLFTNLTKNLKVFRCKLQVVYQVLKNANKQ